MKFTKEQIEFMAKSHTILFCGSLEGLSENPKDVFNKLLVDISDKEYINRVNNGFEKLLKL